MPMFFFFCPKYIVKMTHSDEMILNFAKNKDCVHYVNVSVLIKFSQKTSVFTLTIILVLHKIICFGCVLVSPR